MKETLDYQKTTLDDLAFLDDKTKATLRDFVRRLCQAEGDNLAQVALFGSMVRGDFDEESDTDVFVLLYEGDSLEASNRVCDIAYATMDDEACRFSIYISPLVQTVEELDQEYEGIPW